MMTTLLAVLLMLQASTSTVRLQNNSWARVRVEVRVGSSTRCDSLGTLAIYELRQGQEWEVRLDDPVICWRRERTPGSAGSAWSSWNRVQIVSGENRVMAL